MTMESTERRPASPPAKKKPFLIRIVRPGGRITPGNAFGDVRSASMSYVASGDRAPI